MFGDGDGVPPATDPPVTERVARGAAFLDQASRISYFRLCGARWYEVINLDRLDMTNHERCVLGQLYGWYLLGVTDLGLDPDRAVDLGFDLRFSSRIRPVISLHARREAWRALGEAWVCAIQDRLARDDRDYGE